MVTLKKIIYIYIIIVIIKFVHIDFVLKLVRYNKGYIIFVYIILKTRVFLLHYWP